MSFVSVRKRFNSLGVAADPFVPIPEFPSSAEPYVYCRYDVNSTENIFDTVDQTFAPGDVDTGTNLITLPDIGLVAPNYTGSASTAGYLRKVLFESTGTLPSPLVAGTEYYCHGTAGGGYKVFPVAQNSDGSTLPGWVTGENVRPGQLAAQDVGNIEFADQGTGTHRIYSDEGIQTLVDLTGNNINARFGASNKNALPNTASDENNQKFIVCEGSITKSEIQLGGNYNGHGLGANQTGASFLIAREFVGSKRTLFQVFVIEPEEEITQNVVKFYATSSNVNTTTDTITRSQHKTNTGDFFRSMVHAAGDTLPGGIPASGYIRRVDSDNITLHPTEADATNNTNKIDITSGGTGAFWIYCPKRVGDNSRNAYTGKIHAPASDANSLSTNLNYTTFENFGIAGWDIVITSGGNNGDFGSGASGIAESAFLPEARKVSIDWPSESTAPTRTDTGLELVRGDYWVTRTPGSQKAFRLHDTLESALDNVSIATASATCVKFSSAGDGEFFMTNAEGAGYSVRHQFASTSPLNTQSVIPYNERHVMAVKADFNDPDSDGIRIKMWMDGELILDVENGTKSLTDAAVDIGTTAFTLLNSADFHVPFKGKFYACCFGSSTGEIDDSVLDDLLTYYRSYYSTYLPPTILYSWDMTTVTFDSTVPTFDEIYGD